MLPLLALSGYLFCLSWNSQSAGFLSDDAVYLLMADALSPYGRTNPDLSMFVLKESLFPPMYPLLLAFLGAGSGYILWAHIITTSTLVFALAVYCLWIYSLTRNSWLAVGLPSFFALMPGVVLQNLELLSEFPYLLFSLLALALAQLKQSVPAREALIALLIGLALLTRSAGLALVLACGICSIRSGAWRQVTWLGLALLPSIAWMAFRTVVVKSQGSYQDSWLWVWEQLQQGSATQFLATYLGGQTAEMWHGLVSNIDLEGSLAGQTAANLILIAALPVLIARMRARHLDAWYLLIGLVTLLLWPAPAFFSRLILPWIPIILVYAYLGIEHVVCKWWPPHGRHIVVSAFLGALCLAALPSMLFMARRFAEPVEADLAAWKHTRYWFRTQGVDAIRSDVAFRRDMIHALRELPQWVQPSECVFGVHPSIAMLFSQRIFVLPPSPTTGSSKFMQLSQRCPYIFLVATEGRIDGSPVGSFYPIDRISRGDYDFVHAWKDKGASPHDLAVLMRAK